jgi:serine/threonine-protein kinase
MAEGGQRRDGDEETSEYDSLLRRAASVPQRTPSEPDPTKLAHFRISGRLGAGGMGVVYRAEDEKLKRAVALKVLPRAFADDEERRRRFLREARSAAAIDHPNIATVYDVGEADSRVYIAMQLVEGESLRSRLARGAMPVAEAVRVARAIARGLSRAHARGIVHRDLKPDNVMLDEEGEPKILDFGLAKLREQREETARSLVEHAETASQMTEEGRLLGTPGYMAPEQVRGKEVDARTDVFALGVCIYEMLAGARPFVGEATVDVLMAVTRDPPPPLRERNARVPAVLAAVVDRCLAKAPGDRYASAGEVLVALDGIDVTAPASRGRARTIAIAAGAAIAVAIAAVWIVPRATPAGTSATASASAPISAPAASSSFTRGVAITDHPLPRTRNPDAATAYAAGLQHLRDAQEVEASDDFERASRLDPAMAAAHLRAVLWGYRLEEEAARIHFATAQQHRADLDERDRMLLPVAEAMVADPPSEEETWRRARAVVERYPRDAEAADFLGGLQGGIHDEEERAVLQRALELDPESAHTFHELAQSWHGVDPGKTLDLLGRCLEVSPSAGSCLRHRAEVYADAGECAKLESDARRLGVVEPRGQRTYEYLALAFAARNAPIEAVRDALDKRAALMPDERGKRRATVQSKLWTALLVGDLIAAEGAAREWDDLYASSLMEFEHQAPLGNLVAVLDERGDRRALFDVADSYDRRSAVWSPAFPALRMWLAYERRRAKRIDEATFLRTRDALEREATQRAFAPLRTWFLRAANVETPDEAAEALAVMPDGGLHRQPAGLLAFIPGQMYVRGGNTAEALPWLRRAAGSCYALEFEGSNVFAPTIFWLRAHVQLGQALEQTGDTSGACEAYAVVTDRWRNARPRSLSLEKARERSKSLGCAR